jgi:hypothetical protein
VSPLWPLNGMTILVRSVQERSEGASMLRYVYIFISFILGVESAGVSASECRPTGNTSHVSCIFHLSGLPSGIRGIVLCIIH